MPGMHRLSAARVLAAIMLVLAGCDAGSTGPALPAASDTGSGTIVWLASSINQSPNDPRVALIDAFERAHPAIRVELKAAPTSTNAYHTTLVKELNSGATTPDVYLGDVIWPYEFGAKSLALPLDDLFPRSFWSRFPSSLVQNATYRGSVYAVPLYVNEGLLFYRKDLLEAAHLPVPATWEQLAADAAALKRDGRPYQFVWQGENYEGLTAVWTEMLADASGGLPVGGDTAAELDSPRALRALDFLRSLISGGLSPLDTDTFEETDTTNAFQSGQAAFMRGWNTAYTSLIGYNSTLTAADVGVVAPPTFEGEPGPGWSAFGGWEMYVNPHSANLAADRTFIDWMTGAQAQRILAAGYDEIPGNAAVRDDKSVIAADPSLGVAAGTRLVSRPSADVDYQAVSQAIYQGVYSALPGPSTAGADPCRALVRAAREIDPAVRGTLRCDTGGG